MWMMHGVRISFYRVSKVELWSAPKHIFLFVWWNKEWPTYHLNPLDVLIINLNLVDLVSYNEIILLLISNYACI